MRTKICERLGIETPIFAFSHCRDVVAAASRSGGFGVFGATRYSPADLEVELAWIDAHCGGKPYGVDILMPNGYDRRVDARDVDPLSLIPRENVEFLEDLMTREGVPRLPPDEEAAVQKNAVDVLRTRGTAEKQIEVALRHPDVRMIVNALGVPDRALVDRLHEQGLLVGSLVGSARHARNQLAAGVDVIVAQGTEAAGHTGTVSTLVLVPEVLDVVGDQAAVLAAGGISRGSQVLAMLALGAQGVWCGTLWLTSQESEVTPAERAYLLAAGSEDTVRVTFKTGKPSRTIKTIISREMEKPGAPAALKAPLQQLMFAPFKARLARADRADMNAPPTGQCIGLIKTERSVRQIYADLLNETADAFADLEKLNG